MSRNVWFIRNGTPTDRNIVKKTVEKRKNKKKKNKKKSGENTLMEKISQFQRGTAIVKFIYKGQPAYTLIDISYSSYEGGPSADNVQSVKKRMQNKYPEGVEIIGINIVPGQPTAEEVRQFLSINKPTVEAAKKKGKKKKDWDPNPTKSVGRDDKEKYERCIQEVKKKQAFNLQQYRTANKWYDNSEGPTDKGNEVGKWSGGWLKGEWKCPHCGTMIGRNLKGQIPFALVEEHKKKCKK